MGDRQVRARGGDQTGALVGVRGGITRQTWVDAARKALVESGADEIRVARLARRVHVKHTGFYRHFADLNDLRNALLEDIEERNNDEILVTKHESEQRGLRDLLKYVLVNVGGNHKLPTFELAIRVWMNKSTCGRMIVRRMDEAWIALIGQAFAGESDDLRRSKLSTFVYSLMIGCTGIDGELDTDLIYNICRDLLNINGVA